MVIPDGRRLNLASQSGAEDYVAFQPTFATLNCRQILRPDYSEEMKIQVVVVMGMVANFLTPETFAGVEVEGKRATRGGLMPLEGDYNEATGEAYAARRPLVQQLLNEVDGGEAATLA